MLIDSAPMAGYVLIVEKDPELQAAHRRRPARGRPTSWPRRRRATWAQRSVAVRTPDAVVLDTRSATVTASASPRSCAAIPTRADAHRLHREPAPRREPPRRGAPPLRARRVPGDADRSAQLLALRLAELAAAPPDRAARSRHRRRRPTSPPARRPTSLRDPVQQRERRDVERSAKSLSTIRREGRAAGTLKRTPLARLLRRLYATRATGSLLLLRDSTKKIVLLRRRLPGLREVEPPRRVPRPDPAREEAHHRQGARRLGRAHEDGEAPAGADPGRDGRALALQPAARARRAGRDEAARDLRLARRQVHVQGGGEVPAGATAARASARRAHPRGHPPPLRRGPPEGGAGALRGPGRRAQRRSRAAPAGDDRRSDRAGLHQRASTARDSWRRSSPARTIPTAKARLLLVALSEAGHDHARRGRTVAPPRARDRLPPRRPPARPPSRRQPRAARQRRALDGAADGAHAGLLLGARRRRATRRPPRSTAPTTRSRAASTPTATGSAPTRIAGSRRRSSSRSARRTACCAIRRARRAYVARLARDRRRRPRPSRPHDTVRRAIPTPIRAASSLPRRRRALPLRGGPRAPARPAPPRGRRGPPPGRAPRSPTRPTSARPLGWALFREAPADARAAPRGPRRAASRRPARRTQPPRRRVPRARSTPRPARPRRPSRSSSASSPLDPGAVEIAEELRRLRSR